MLRNDRTTPEYDSSLSTASFVLHVLELNSRAMLSCLSYFRDVLSAVIISVKIEVVLREF